MLGTGFHINNYDKDIFIGDSGAIISVDLEESLLQIKFDERDVDYGIV